MPSEDTGLEMFVLDIALPSCKVLSDRKRTYAVELLFRKKPTTGAVLQGQD